MVQFVVVPLSVHNSNGNNPITVTKHELPRYRSYQNPTKPGKHSKEGNYSTPYFKYYTFIKQNLGVSSHKAITFQHKKFGWEKDWRVVEGLRATPEA